MHVGIVGAGAAGAAAAYTVDAVVPAAEITVLEKSGGVCGRAAARRRGPITYEYGANYLKDDDERVVELVTEELSTEGLVDIAEPIHVFDAEGTVSEGRGGDARRWTYRDGITQLAKRLFDGTDATVHRNTRVTELSRTDGWRVETDDGRERGPFDALVLTPPAPQSAALLETADWAAPLREELATAAAEVPFRTIWTAVLGYETAIDRPYYALVNPGKDHDVGWIGREECKPGHVPGGQSVLLVQAAHDWSRDNIEAAPETVADELATMTADIVGEAGLADPDWVDTQRWRYALPEGGAPAGPVASAREHDLYLAGDWVAGEARLHAAVRNGLETGERIAHRR